MSNFHFVKIAKSLPYLPDNQSSRRIRNGSMIFGKLGKRSSAKLFHDDIYGLVVLEAINNFDN